MTSEYRLRIPGPTTVPERIRLATAAPIHAHRGAEFKAMLAEVQAGLRAVYGTAMMEAAIAAALGAKVDTLDCEWGRGIDAQQLAARICGMVPSAG